ncbi:glycosyltransferase [Candidatus Dependentiae bacterium]
MNIYKISVVLGSYNGFDFLKLAINSIRNELQNFSHEIIVVDGGSTDKSTIG